jgi:hypothetical protein
MPSDDELISQFIDDELDLPEKIRFVQNVQSDPDYAENTISLLDQEITLRTPLQVNRPMLALPSRSPRRWIRFCLQTASAGLAAAILVFVLFRSEPEPRLYAHRFVIFVPETRQVEIAGSFTEWQKLPMNPAGQSGYWEISLDLPPGEHRYSYFLDKDRPVVDPTTGLLEKDDFGNQNSILRIGAL